MPGADFLPRKREVELKYRNQDLTVRLDSLGEEVDLKFAAVVKGLAVQQGKLGKMWCEDLLVSDAEGACPLKAKIHPELLKEAKAARHLAGNMVADASVSTADVLVKLFAQKSPALMLMDPNFKVELALLNLLTSGGSHGQLNKSILQCLPTKSNLISAECAAQRLNNLTTGALYKLSSRACQEQLKLTLELVGAIVQGRVPQVDEAARP